MEGIDSNILIYAFDESSRFHKVAVDFIEKKIKTCTLGIAEFSLLEFYAVITDGRKVGKPMPSNEAFAIIRDFYESRSFTVLPCLPECLKMTIEEAHGFLVKRNDIYDFIIASTFKKNGLTSIYTLNTKDFRKFEFIQAIDPFAAPRTPDSGPRTTDHGPRTPDHGPRTPDPGFIPYGRQSITEKDVAAVCSVLRSDLITQGPKVPEFEKAVSLKVGAKHAVAANSATSALHLACRALDVSPGDIVWTSPITFVASANCALYCGAQVDFVDIDPHTYNMSVQALETKLVVAERNGTLPKVVIPVHMCGQPCEMAAIHALSKKYGFSIIEDASHAIGGYYKNESVGNCRYSHITVFSFHPVKIITTAEGGMAVTNDPDLAQQMELLRSHGITRNPITDPGLRTPDPGPRPTDFGPWYYQQIDLGYNYRMTDIQAALGFKQLERLNTFVARRRELARRYDDLLDDLPVRTPWQHPDTYSAWHLYVIRLQLVETGPTRRQVFEYLREKGIGVNVHYIPVHTQPYYRRMGFDWGIFPAAEKYYQEAITLPLFPAMTEKDQDRVVDALKRTLPTEHTEGHGNA